MTNYETKCKIKQAGFTLWQIAEAAGVTENTVVRWLRSEHDTRNQGRILHALEKLMNVREEVENNG